MLSPGVYFTGQCDTFLILHHPSLFLSTTRTDAVDAYVDVVIVRIPVNRNKGIIPL